MTVNKPVQPNLVVFKFGSLGKRVESSHTHLQNKSRHDDQARFVLVNEHVHESNEPQTNMFANLTSR